MTSNQILARVKKFKKATGPSGGRFHATWDGGIWEIAYQLARLVELHEHPKPAAFPSGQTLEEWMAGMRKVLMPILSPPLLRWGGKLPIIAMPVPKIAHKFKVKTVLNPKGSGKR